MSTPLPDTIGNSVKKRLFSINITSLEQLMMIDQHSLLKLHGIGPQAVKQLEEMMEENGLSMLKEPLHSFSAPFIVYGNLKCDNASKRRVIRDYIILLWMKETHQLTNLLTENVVMDKIGSDKLTGIDAIINSYDDEGKSVRSLEIKEILSHGKEGAAHGTVTFSNDKQIHFSEFYTFESHKKDARISFITNYTLHSK